MLTVLRASCIGLLVKMGLEFLLIFVASVQSPLLLGTLSASPAFIGGFTGGFLVNRGVRGGVGSGVLLVSLMLLLLILFTMGVRPSRYEIMGQPPGVVPLLSDMVLPAAAAVVGGAIGGWFRAWFRLRVS